jgi:uncharacterized protein
MLVVLVIIFALIGVIAGLLAGLLGISGGVVTIPLLVLVFTYLGFPEICMTQLAMGTSLAAMTFNAFSSTWAHHKKRNVFWDVVRSMSPGIVVGSILGAFIARQIDSTTLRLIFGIFEMLLGLYFLIPVKLHEGDHRLPGRWPLSWIGMGIGSLSSILGIGGGVVTVPTLMAFHVKPKKAVATSAATGLLISTIGASAYLLFGLSQDCGVQYSVGYLYLPAFIAISVSSFFAAPYGAKLAHILHPNWLRRIFAISLVIAGLLMIFE